MTSSISSATPGKKVDMSESAMAAYRRRLARNDYPLPSDPVVGISRDSSLSSAVLATQSDLMPKLWYPDGSSDTALRASTLANKTDSSPRIWQPTLSADAATAALKSKEHTKVPHHEPAPLSKSASKAALQAAETPGEVYGAKYLKDGYEFTAKTKEPVGEWAHMAATRTKSKASLTAEDERLAEQSSAAALKMGGTNEQLQRMDISKIEGLARERARKTLSNVYIDITKDRLAFKGANSVAGQPAPSDPNMLDYIGEQQYWQRQDVLSLVSIADRNVKSQLAAINKDVADMNIGGTLEAQRKAYQLATANHEKRTVHLGKINVGGGLYMTQEEIDDIARRNVQPTLDEVTEMAAEKREADRIEAERLEKERKAKEEERRAIEAARRKEQEAKEKERREQHEARMVAQEKMRKERAAARQEKDEMKAEARRAQQEHKATLRREAEARAAANRQEAEARANARRLEAEDRAASRRLEAEARAEARRAQRAAPAVAAPVAAGTTAAVASTPAAATSAAPAMASASNPVTSGTAANAAVPAVAAPAAATSPATKVENPVTGASTGAEATTEAAAGAAAGADTEAPTGVSAKATAVDSSPELLPSASPPTRTVSGSPAKTSYTSKSGSMFRKWFGTAVKGVAAGGAAAGSAAGGISVKPVSLQDNRPTPPEAREKIARSPEDVPNADTLADYKLEARRLKIDRQSYEKASENAADVRREADELVESLKSKHTEAADADKAAIAREIDEAKLKATEAASADDRAREVMLAAVSRHRDAKARYHELNRILKAAEAAQAVPVDAPGSSTAVAGAVEDAAEGTATKAVAADGAAAEGAAAKAVPAEGVAAEGAAAKAVAAEGAAAEGTTTEGAAGVTGAVESAAAAEGTTTENSPPIDTKTGFSLVGEKLDLKSKEDKFAGFDSSNVDSSNVDSGEGIFKEDI